MFYLGDLVRWVDGVVHGEGRVGDTKRLVRSAHLTIRLDRTLRFLCNFDVVGFGGGYEFPNDLYR